jgi:hypothetical protein
MFSNLSFDIAKDGSPYPVRFESTVLDEFERDHLNHMDLELRKFSDQTFGPTFFLDHQNRLSVIAELIRDALESKNGILLAKYALWMASHYPEISGIRIENDTYEFTAGIYDETAPEGCSIH